MKKVIVTGSSRGIGLEIVLAFGRAGYQVFATMATPSKAINLTEIINDEGLPITLHKMNVNSDISVKACMDEILIENDSIDVLVNNAGIGLTGCIEKTPISDFKAVFETNVFGAVRCMQSVIPSMRKGKSGCIINVNSVSGRLTSSPLGCYSANKFALNAISEALAQEVKPYNIRVGIIEPGIIDTDIGNKIEDIDPSIDQSSKRMADLFIASLKYSIPATLVADAVVEFASGDSWILRHPVGSEALPFIQSRKYLNDVQWIDRSVLSDEELYDAVEREFGMNARRLGWLPDLSCDGT